MVHILAACGEDWTRWPAAKFDQAKWTQTVADQRYVFVRDLVDSKKLPGLSKEYVIDMLGEPSFDNDGDYVTYVIKADSGSVFVLDIRFENNHGKKLVNKVLVRAD
jgi:hypothetical protein